jgi:ribonuclease D
VEIAKRQPKSAEELKTIRGLASLSPRQAAEQLIVAIKRGQSAPPVERPRGTPRRPANEEQMIVKILSAALIQVAHSQRVAPGLLGSNEDLREFLRYVLDPSDDSEPPKLASGWRRSICWEYLSDVLEGRVSLRIRRTGEHLDLEFHSG